MKYLPQENHLMDMNILYRFTKRKMEDVYFNFVYQPYLKLTKPFHVTIIAYEVTKQVHLKDQLIEAIANAAQNKNC
jgi:hypothetical protein